MFSNHLSVVSLHLYISSRGAEGTNFRFGQNVHDAHLTSHKGTSDSNDGTSAAQEGEVSYVASKIAQRRFYHETISLGKQAGQLAPQFPNAGPGLLIDSDRIFVTPHPCRKPVPRRAARVENGVSQRLPSAGDAGQVGSEAHDFLRISEGSAPHAAPDPL